MPEFAKELARKNPEQVAIRDDKESLTWDDVEGILNRAVNRLLETDLGPQRRISVFAENSNQTALAHLAGLLAGASTVPVNFHLTAEEAAYILQDSETSVLFLGPETVERGLEAAQIAGIQKVIAWSDKKEPYSDFEIWNSWYEEASSEDPITNLKPLPHLLYTSGTTGHPKGIVRDIGGHIVALKWTMKNIYNIDEDDIWWSASDIGWIVGHSYIVYAPLFYGCTTVLFEGKPVGTPDAGVFWRVISEYKIKSLFTAPTAFRAIKKEDPEGKFFSKYDLSAFKSLFSVSYTHLTLPTILLV